MRKLRRAKRQKLLHYKNQIKLVQQATFESDIYMLRDCWTDFHVHVLSQQLSALVLPVYLTYVLSSYKNAPRVVLARTVVDICVVIALYD